MGRACLVAFRPLAYRGEAAICRPLKRVEGGGLRVERCGPRAEGDEHHALSGQVRAGVPGSPYISRIKHGDTTWPPNLQSSGMFNRPFLVSSCPVRFTYVVVVIVITASARILKGTSEPPKAP